MTDPDRSFGFAGRYLFLLIVVAVGALIAVGIHAARQAPAEQRGALGPLSGEAAAPGSAAGRPTTPDAGRTPR